jgi:esterase/lipase
MNKLIETMKNWIKNRKAAKLPVLYCIHGFGVRRSVEFEPLKKYFESKGHTVITIHLFDQSDETDTDPQIWIQRAKDGLEPLIKENRRVWLVGFSMGGVIASYLASLYPVERVVLLAPAFEYVTLQTVKKVASEAVRAILNKPKTSTSDYPALPDSFSTVFRSVITSCKDSIGQVNQPVLFMHGSEDEVIPIRSSQNAYAKVQHPNKLLLVIQGVLHRILDDETHQADVLHIIDDFFSGKLVQAGPKA